MEASTMKEPTAQRLPTPIVALVGRPNVGKSTLFNRVLKTKKAIVEDTPGVTRDRNYALVEDFTIPFVIVDTGGFESSPQDPLTRLVVEQTLIAIEEADLAIALFDGNAGLQPGDEDVVDLLRRSGKKAIFAVNKCDGIEQAYKTADFYRLGVTELVAVTALHGRGVNELIAVALKSLPNYDALYSEAESIRERREEEEEAARIRLEAEVPVGDGDDLIDAPDFVDGFADGADDDGSDFLGSDVGDNTVEQPNFAPVYVPGDDDETSEAEYDRAYRLRSGRKPGIDHDEELELPEELQNDDVETIPALPIIRVGIIGRPNVGKSTLLNTLVGEQRALATDTPGTTRDTLDVTLSREGQSYVVTDTAGLRKQGRVTDRIEKYSAMRTLRALSGSDVAVVVLDATSGPTEQDARIVGQVHEEGKGLVLAVNKWDLVEKDHRTVREVTEQVREAFKFAPYAPLIFISALSGRRCPRVLETVLQVAQQRERRVSTHRLNLALKRAARRAPTLIYRGQAVKLYYAAQIDTAPPRFVLFFNQPRGLHFSYLRFIKNVIREEFGFDGNDLKLVVRKR